MDGLYTVFGLGTAFGVFCSWLYDVIRRRNLPASRGASFEAFHATAEQGSPVLAPVRGIDPVLDPAESPVAPVDIPVLTPPQELAPAPAVAPSPAAASSPAVEPLKAVLVAPPVTVKQPASTTPVKPVQTDELVIHSDFADTVSFADEPQAEPAKDALRVGLVINGALEREIKEADLPGLLQELGIDANSGQAEALQSGTPVQLGDIKVQLVQI